ncbi:Hypothetical protein, predicted transmembrane protein [Mycoplasmopsis bovigenitalium 51080]|uniref:ECF transporter S component n=1 Tax=Mycoplasmopsis bovigenitalium 51080 TaxID=1188235 RepID=N9VDT8_9BACT|nr:hypothetical protein [Mycoplasmopsis bovigenitalium]ENY69818.1 Hypothetical protein, predicted transmembrane protein [Mycoplasmopsis bovigenitalium 51080]
MPSLKLIYSYKSRSFFTYELTSLSIYLAYFIASGFSVFLAYIPFGPAWLTYLPVILAIAVVHLGFKGAFVSGLGFGFSSFIASIIVGLIWFQYVDVSILPRFFVGLGTYLAYLLLRMNNKPKLWKFIILTLIATELNTLFVFTALYVHSNFINTLAGLPGLKTFIVLNTINLIFEPIANVLIGLAVYIPLINFRNTYEYKKTITW